MLLSSVLSRSSRALARQIIPVVRNSVASNFVQRRGYVYIQSPPGGWSNVRDFNEDEEEESDVTIKRIPIGDFRENVSGDDYSGEQSDMEDFYDISMPGGDEVMDFLSQEDDRNYRFTASEIIQDVDFVADAHGGEEYYGYRMVSHCWTQFKIVHI